MTERAVAGPSGPGTVVMELGAGVGALILYTPAGLDGEEIEISRDGERAYALAGPAAAPARPDQVRGGLPRPAGRALHRLARRHTPAAAVTVSGGQVSSCHWPG